MVAITAALVKELRERTSLGMMECKKALVEAEGDIEKAIEQLRASGQAKAAKKAGRVAAEGAIMATIDDDGHSGTIVEVNCETDFVARDENFIQFVEKILNTAHEAKTQDMSELMTAELEDQRQALVQKIGENINPRRVFNLTIDAGVVESYVHGNQRVGALVAISTDNKEAAKDLAMHIVATNPLYANPEDVPENVLEKEREIYLAKAQQSGKPEDIVKKMVEGNVRKYYGEVCLMEQAFVKDPSVTIKAMLGKANAELIGYTRFEVGEGIEKEETDFAAEVMAQARGGQ